MASFPKLPRPVTPREVYVVPATIDPASGRERVTRVVMDGILKPSDIAGVELAEPALLYVPFWRVDVRVDSFHLDVSTARVPGESGVRIPIPTGGSRFREGAVMIAARTALPYEPKLPSFLGKLTGEPPLEVASSELVPAGSVTAMDALDDHERVDADVDQAQAEGIATGLLLRALSPTHAMYATYEPKIEGSSFCLYPVYYARYEYEGEARRHRGEEFFVAVSGLTGEVLAARHPSAVRAMATKLRKLLSFDFR